MVSLVKCDPWFSAVDHVAGSDKMAVRQSDTFTAVLTVVPSQHVVSAQAPPKFELVEYTPVEYELVEYREDAHYFTVDYEEFSRGDDLGDLTEVAWPERYIPQKGLGDVEGQYDTFSSSVSIVFLLTSNILQCLAIYAVYDDEGAKDQESLTGVQKDWLNAGQVLAVTENLIDFLHNMEDDTCDALGPFILCAGASLGLAVSSYFIQQYSFYTCMNSAHFYFEQQCVPNPARFACVIAKMITKSIAYNLLLGASIAYHVLDTTFEIDTLG